MPFFIRRSSVLALVLALGAAMMLLVPVEPAGALPSGAPWYQQWSLPETWKVSEGAGVKVAVLDSGVKGSLGDLRGQVLPGVDLTDHPTGAQHDQPVPGEINFGHGTDMAALIAGTGKGAGLVGVAPKAKILPVRVGVLGADSSAAIKGIRWAVDHGAKVISMSFGSSVPCKNTFFGPAIAYAYRHDAIVVASAGNDPGPVDSPGDCPGVITIGGADASFRPTKTSTGPELDFVAPGAVFLPELLDNTLGRPQQGNDSTSQATALAAGVFALLRAKYPTESARQIVTRALYAAHGQSGRTPARISNALGYGSLMPKAALTQKLPAQATNPIYDRFDAELRGVGDQPATPTITSTPVHNSSTKGPLIVTIVVVLVAIAVIVLIVRLRRDKPTGPYIGR
ncbi:MAG TPA: S8 family serine peptidase [Jatrophihabitantaceae bacterium]